MAISKVTLNGTTLMDVTNNTANKDNTLTGYTGTKNDGTTFTGEYSVPSIEANKTYTVNSSGTLTVNPSTNYDAMEKVTLTVDSGTQGTPTATKGTVSNHSISITPSVTNTTGYITGATKTGTAVSVSASELVSGTKSITNNGTGIDVTNYASVDVNVQGSSVNIQTDKTYSVSSSGTNSIQPDTGYDAMDSVELIVPSQTLPSSPTTTGSGSLVNSISRSTSVRYLNIPTGFNDTAKYYQINAVPNGTATSPTSITGTLATVSTGTNTLTLTKSVSNTPRITTAGYISSGTAGNSDVSLTANVTTQAAQTITPTTTNQTIASGTYLTGTQTISGDVNLVASNIKKDISIFNVTGTYEGGSSGSSYTLLASEDFTVSTSSTTATSVGTITIDSSAYTSAKIIYIKVRDKAGARNGYFVGSDTYIFNPYPANGETVAFTVAARIIHRRNSSGGYQTYTAGSSTGYGVYGYQVTTSGDVIIYRRYNSTYSLTINGTYRVEVYALDYAPNQGNPYNYSYSS